MRRAALLLPLLAACAAESRAARWLDPLHVERTDGKEGTPAVVLEKSDRLVIYPSYGRFEYTEFRHHEVIQILTEGGVDLADRRIRHHDKAKLTEVRARSIDPDGTTHDLDPGNVMEDVEAETEDTTFKVKAFRVPGVKVGSVIELAYTIRYEFAVTEWYESVADWVPVKRYDVEILVGSRVRYALRTYNAGSSFERGSEGDFARFAWTLRDVPSVERDGYSPHWSVASPWWIYRTKQEVYGGGGYDMIDDWSDALASDFDKLLPSSDLFDEKLPALGADCGTSECRVEAALAEARKVPLRRTGGLGAARKMSEIRSSGWATRSEKAMVLLDALRRAGIAARPAFATTAFTVRSDPAFPWTEAWNRLIVQLPAQPGIPAPRWLDPICDRCGPGELPASSLGAEAMVVQADDEYERNDEVAVERVTIQGIPLTEELDATRHLLKLDAAGNATVVTDFDVAGQRAIWSRARNVLSTPADWKRESERMVTSRITTARLTGSRPTECESDRERCRTHLEYQVDGFATMGPDRILVPLGVLWDSWDGRFQEKERESGIVISEPVRYEEELVVELPDGFAADGLPATERAEAPGFAIGVEARSEPGKVVIRRSLQERRGAWEADTYAAHRAALKPYWALRDKVLVLVPTAK